VVAKAEPDGYTLGMSILGPLGINAILFGKLPYDPAKDLAFITMLVTQPNALAVNAALPVSNAQELLKLIKDNPGKYNFGSIGNGSLSHLSMEAMVLMAGSKMVHIPYPGSPAAMTALMRNDVQVASLPAIAVTPHLGSGQIKLLAISSEQRSALLPNVPTLKESGIDLVGDAWSGLVAPANTPAPIVEKISQATRGALADPGFQAKLVESGFDPVLDSSPAKAQKFLVEEHDRLVPIIKATGFKME
jgi:tripartite-type tricarboxylate transporter receptor subunit TctC